ncbi:MAG: hypothetical protein IPJ43_11085 [Saprospiraceae bacterium]|nr:hypothetical protein [Saprospiraceae bacterium]
MNKIVTFFIMSLLLISCKNNGSSNEQNEKLQLNNGQKWKVDEKMLVYIRNMESDILDFSNTDQKDFNILTEKLQSNIDLLTSNCTMKGDAHDALHKWLLPYIEIVNTLSETKNATEASTQFENIQTLFSTFNQYFQ